MDKMFWTDVAKKGAILGVLMLASHILEQVLMLNGNTSRMFVAGIEMLVVALLYIYLMYRFVKGYSNTFSAEEGFSYGRGFTYVVYASLLAGVIVGFGSYVYVHWIVGYGDYIDGMVNMYASIIDSAAMPASLSAMYEGMFEQLESQPEPSVFSTLFSTLWGYIMWGVIIGLIIAGIVKRTPKLFDETDE